MLDDLKDLRRLYQRLTSIGRGDAPIPGVEISSDFTKKDVVVGLDMTYYGQNRGASSWTSIADNFKGKNWLGGIPNTPKNDDFVGLNFITRPELNLQYDNIGTNRILTPLNTNDPLTAQYAMKMYLDPVGCVERGYSSPLADPAYAFLPFLDNSIIDASGWPDITMDEDVSNEGHYKEQFGRLKGVTNRLAPFSLNINHVNTKGSPINLFYSTILAYVEALNKRRLYPYTKNVVENRYDYFFRYYRFVLDPFHDKVVMSGCNGYMYPRTDPIGSVMNFATSKPINDGYDTVSVQWSCFGAFYNDPRILHEFNRTVCYHNPLMKDSTRRATYQRVPASMLSNVNYRGYPFIDLRSNQFQVWVRPEDWRRQLALVDLKPEDVNVEDVNDRLALRDILNAANNIRNGGIFGGLN